MFKYRRFKQHGLGPNYTLKAITTFLKFVVVILEAVLN